jgi:hypothetical protein
MAKTVDRATFLRLWGEAYNEKKGYDWITAELGEGFTKKDVQKFAGECRRSFIPLPSLRGAERQRTAKTREVSVEELQALAEAMGISVDDVKAQREAMIEKAKEKEQEKENTEE